MLFSDARGLPHPLRACPLPARPPLCLPRPLHPGVFIDVYLDLLPGRGPGGSQRFFEAREPESAPLKAWGGLPAFCLTVAQGRGRTRFYTCFPGTVGLIVTLPVPQTFYEKSSLHFVCLCGESERASRVFNCGVCVYCARILDRCLCVHPVPGLKRVIEDGCVWFQQILHRV